MIGLAFHAIPAWIALVSFAVGFGFKLALEKFSEAKNSGKFREFKGRFQRTPSPQTT